MALLLSARAELIILANLQLLKKHHKAAYTEVPTERWRSVTHQGQPIRLFTTTTQQRIIMYWNAQIRWKRQGLSKVTNLDVFILTSELRWQCPTLVQTPTEKQGEYFLKKLLRKRKKEKVSFSTAVGRRTNFISQLSPQTETGLF